MSSRPGISVVVTTHRRPLLLARALQSLLAQSFKDFEIILCADEGSRETRATAQQYLREGDAFLAAPRLKGPAETRNLGVANANGRYLCFLDDDDTFEVGFFSDFMGSIGVEEPVLYYFNYRKIHEDRSVDPRSIAEERITSENVDPDSVLVGNILPNNAYMLHASTARRFAFDARLRSHEDWDYLISLRSQIEFRYRNLYGPVVHVATQSGRNYGAYGDGSVALDFLAIYRRWPVTNPDVRTARQLALQRLGLVVPAELL